MDWSYGNKFLELDLGDLLVPFLCELNELSFQVVVFSFALCHEISLTGGKMAAVTSTPPPKN